MISRTSVMEVVISGFGANINLSFTKDSVTIDNSNYGDERLTFSKAAALALAVEIKKYYHELEEANAGAFK
jgi:hypothetical protein